MGCCRWRAPAEPQNGTPPKVKMPPSAPTSQYPPGPATAAGPATPATAGDAAASDGNRPAAHTTPPATAARARRSMVGGRGIREG